MALSIDILRKVCAREKYIACRFTSGIVVGINCKAIELGNNKNLKKGHETDCVSYRIIDFQEYISIKAPFIKRK